MLAPAPKRRGLARLPRAAQWLLLLGLSALLAGGLLAVELPAALLLGPMVAGIVAGTNGATIRVPRLAYVGGQALIGCLVAAAITGAIVETFLRDWPLFLGVVCCTLAASSALGWLMSRWRVMPGSTAVWGTAPGAASAMVLMAEAFGADVRLVAFMQYLRVVCVASAAAVIASFWVDVSDAARSPIVWFPPLDWPGLLTTLAIAFGGALLGRLARIPAGALLVPLVVAAVLHAEELVTLVLPEWLMAACYALLGWSIGLGFTSTVLRHASRALPRVILSIAVLLAFCGGLAFLLAELLGIDPLTAYLATSPGGMDSIAIIAASSNVDLAFVMALQTVRFVIVLFLGPPLARFIAKRTGGG